ncbi:MAG: HigA family addiction module antitoxin [Proteiniphilum sp.]|jgi:addiction module HigA family antidote|uniref:HigA family addiction module antitoxin n=1 Tax=Proteiniphilum sp. TaxID=1926877 RepID=UPI0009280986|nr:HigA family addiction module antitoxin [Proteiniphilum sp.]MEA5128661.1 HigA family addiction module antitoxin [Proteiniphilum sp.]OJV87279.1 MAG: addiction module antidote protein, HigA family [Bacteroidia bacterium 44-10]
MIKIEGIDSHMIANNLTPYEPTHPGEVLKEEIEFRGISQRKLATQMGVAYSVLNEVLNCKRPVTTEYALLFEAALGIEAEMLLKMQSRYNVQTIRQNKSWNDRLAEIRKATAVL